ncbi:MAG: prepilin-type N-terminal cleavage/methylation domain-containing protein [Opitutales bacterium]|nr:prepilin-type N-terminal cleavage/methylation domain-containing protein [Opitutales bacterium]
MKKAFTLVEIIICVVLLGALVALAYPATKQYMATRAQAYMQDDGSRLGSAAQVYFAETFESSVTLKYNRETGAITAPDQFKMLNGNRIEKGYNIPAEFTISRDNNEAIKLVDEAGGTYIFDDKGKLTRTHE